MAKAGYETSARSKIGSGSLKIRQWPDWHAIPSNLAIVWRQRTPLAKNAQKRAEIVLSSNQADA
jgi:hypothetical protein